MSEQVRMIGDAETQVIQATLRVDAGRDTAISDSLHQPLDWAHLQALAKFHGVRPLVYTHLLEVAPGLVPSAALQEMATFRKTNEWHSLRMTVDLCKIIRALEAEGIPVLALKGPTLAVLAFGDPALRDFGDLDILLHSHDTARAHAVLLTLGMQPAQHETAGEASLDWERHAHYQSRHTLLEVHWRIATREYPRALETTELFTRSRQVVLNGQTLDTLCGDDLALHICHHGMQHCWTIFRYIADFTAVLRTLDASRWAVLLNSAHKQGLYRPMLIGMQLSHELCGLALPVEIAQAVKRELLAQHSVSAVCINLARVATTGRDLVYEQTFKALTAEKGVWLLLRNTFTPTVKDYQWVDLPLGLRWLYPVLRPFRRIARGLAIMRTRNRKSYESRSKILKAQRFHE